jgi:glycosyltransferase 2 family protein
VLAAVLALAVLLRHRRALILRFVWLHDAWACLSVRPLVWFGLTLAAWAAQGMALWLICRDMGVSLALPTATGFYAVAMVAGALSALPAGLGGTEAVLTALLVAHGAGAGDALAITVLTRLLTLWLAVAIGVMALLYSAAIAREISFR